MKKLVLVLLCVLPLVSFSQTNLTFKNIPIKGTMSEFVEKMKEAGFSFVQKVDDASIMEGVFASEKCQIFILSSMKTNHVWKVAAFLPESDSWSSLKSDYFKFKSQFTTKYGKPSDCYEFFTTPYYEGDGYETQALGKNKCTYVSYWNLDNGVVSVSIGSSNIILAYEDSEGSDINDKEENESIIDDI